MAERAAKQLELNKSELPNSITEVIATLSRAGFEAYIVGGGVRDTLLGLQPKDFDAVTDAKPHEIKDVFGKRCRIIGRRFQLAHVYSGRELIEVATFRGPPNNNANTNQDGMILRDNVWGDIKQDFARRDFSINALYYQPLKGVVHDFCGALKDIKNKTIRLLGHAPVRIEEDPVRLLRALRFKAKLGFEFDKELSEQFHDDNWALLEQISPHRLYDETQKMFTGGYLVPLLPLLFESGAIDSLIIYPPSEPSALVQQVAINTDKRIAAGKSINPAFFYAALLWENYLHQLEKAKKRNMPFAEAQLHAAHKVVDRQRIKTAIPKFAEQFIRDIWILQPKLSAPRSKQIEQLAEHPRFRAGFDFLLLREQCGDAEHPLSESTNGMGEWWQTYQTLSEKEQQQAIEDFDENIRRGAYKQGKRGRGRNRQQQPDHQAMDSHAKQDDAKTYQDSKQSRAKSTIEQAMNDTASIPSKRRRRPEDSAVPTESPVKSKQATSKKSANNQYPSNEQVKQDNAELAQLQALSLVNSQHQSSDQQRTSKPEPLFVIEQERVVPPLNKQSSSENKTHTKGDRKAVSNVKTADTQSETRAAQVVQDQQSSDKPVQSQPSDKQQAADKAADRITKVAQTPQLVSLSNEPIPHKRRRRQPSATPDSNSHNSVKAKTKYQKKAPKVVEPPKTSANKTDNSKATSQPVSQTLSVNKKGPVPAKRRRRQPSSNA
ncbi:polynucleotide adenylyltransferase PcnB [Psychrobacter jeotgali]|uniref:polynucleotide adenylyltransferase PcnB n=1 Tax=Psychrobacter jeotgali TaxID=179010 RepID=UPI0019190B5C|nr:polynucleotide adenylyltransferase PcnB [Psychrobacter jeotgali]